MKPLHPVKIIVFAVAVGCFALAGLVAQADIITWTNAASGGWNTAVNWNPNVVPGAADTAVITNAGVTVSLNGATTVGAIILGTNGPGTVTLTLAGQTLALNGPLSVNHSGSFTVDGGTLVGNINAVLNGTIGWSAGILEGILTLSSGSTLTLTTGNNHDIPNCTFTNNGTVVWSAGEIRGGGLPGTVIDNHGVWEAQNDSTWDDAYGGSFGTVFNNFGTFRKSGSTGGNTTFLVGTTFNQLAGKLDSQTNSIVLTGGGNFTGGTATNLTGFVILNGGAFNINGTATSTNVQLAGATLTGSNVISGGFNWISGLWNGTSDTITTNTTVLITTGNNHDLANCTVTNNGTVVWSAGEIRGGGNPATVIYNNGLWEAQNDSTWDEAYGGLGTFFNNFGTFRKSGSTGGNTTIFMSAFNNTGTIDVQTNSVIFQTDATFSPGSVFNGAGSTILSSGNFSINGATINSTLQLNGGSIGGTNTLSGTFIWNGGSFINATLTITTGGALNIVGANNHDMPNCTFINNGTVVWVTGEIRGGGNPGTVIYNNGVWDAQNDSTWDNAYGGSGTVFNNFGTFRKSAGTKPNSTIFQSGVAFVNNGTVDAATNAVVTIAGNYTQLLGGSIHFDIGGTTPGIDQSQLNVTGIASLNGLIGLRFSPGYIPAVNSSNLVLTAGSRSGQFSFQDHFFLLGQNKRINPIYSPTNLVLMTIGAADPTNISLSTGSQGQTFALAWPSEFVGYDLEVKTNLEDSNWTIVPGVTNFYTETPPTSPHKFFRLFKPL